MRLGGTKATAIHQYRGLGNQLYDLAGSRPSLDLRFADSKSLVDATTGQNLVTFTRASGATYVDSQGVIRNAVTNLLLRSEELTSASWVPGSGVSVTADNSQGQPFSSPQAYRIDYPGSNLNFSQTITGISGTAYTLSIYVKGNTGETIRLSSSNLTGAATFTLTGSWQRISTTGTSSSTSLTLNLSTFGGATARTVYATAAQLEQSSTVGEYVPTGATINSAPRFDHNPTTGESLGLLVEEQRTNSIRNNTMQGAVAGTPGTLPTNWPTGSQAGLSREIVAIGTTNGIPYVDIRYFGTTNTTFGSFFVEANNSAVAANGQAWTASAWLGLVAGTTANITSLNIGVRFNNSSGALLTQGVTDVLSSVGTFQRVSGSATASDATTAFANIALTLGLTNAAAVDFTLRIGLPQLEQGAFATSVIPTTASAATRSADVASISGSNFSSWYRQDEGTVFAEATLTGRKASIAFVQIQNSDATNRLQLRQSADGLSVLAQAIDGANSTAGLSVTAFALGLAFKGAFAIKASDYTASFNGGSIGSSSALTTMPTVDRLTLTPSAGSSAGTIRRLTYWPARLGNEVLQRITQ
jgi:hypothetical protein